MVTLLSVMMMALNMWVAIYLIWEDREYRRAGAKRKQDEIRQELPDIMGKSKFRMPDRKKTDEDTSVPEAATYQKAEAVDEKDVTFADEMPDAKSQKSMRVSDEELDDVFADNRVSTAGVTYPEDEGLDDEPEQADGTTFEDIDKAVHTVKKERPTEKELDHAGKVFNEMEGNEMFHKLTASPEMYAKIREVVDRHFDKAVKKAGCADDGRPSSEKKESISNISSDMPPIPDSFEDFDIRDYV